MSIKVKNCIINISRCDLDPTVETGKHLKPTEFLEKMKDPNSIVVDMRSDYEYHVGRFKNAVTFDIHHF